MRRIQFPRTPCASVLKKSVFLVFSLLFISAVFTSEKTASVVVSERLPQIAEFSRRDVVFSQFCRTVAYNDIQHAAGRECLDEFYAYRCRAGDSLLSLHAATGIPYDTLATLNRISSPDENLTARTIVIPVVKGIFVPLVPESAVETLLRAEIPEESGALRYEIDGRAFDFFSGARFSQAQRAFFLDTSFRLPLDTRVVSSGFGYRNSPVYGKWKFHKGIDFAASQGEAVYSCKGGTVSFVLRNDAVFGNYIIIAHQNGLTSVYAHLSRILVRKGETVGAGQKIGEVGQTGFVTGPHLHFEIRQNGTAADPDEFLPGG